MELHGQSWDVHARASEAPPGRTEPQAGGGGQAVRPPYIHNFTQGPTTRKGGDGRKEGSGEGGQAGRPPLEVPALNSPGHPPCLGTGLQGPPLVKSREGRRRVWACGIWELPGGPASASQVLEHEIQAPRLQVRLTPGTTCPPGPSGIRLNLSTRCSLKPRPCLGPPFRLSSPPPAPSALAALVQQSQAEGSLAPNCLQGAVPRPGNLMSRSVV